MHRSGRSARCGRDGDALAFLTPSEESYVEYMERHENVTMRQLPIQSRFLIEYLTLKIRVI